MHSETLFSDDELKDLQEKICGELAKVKRDGIDLLIDFLKNHSDFFSSPASTKYHLSTKGGLALHSWNVFEILAKKNKEYSLGICKETVIICGLLHDLCKANTYTRATNGYGFSVVDKFPTGHGEKSVFLIQRFMPLTDEEIAMIRWHMQHYDISIHFDYPNGYPFRAAIEKWPGVPALFIADYEATTLAEKNL